MLGLKGISDNVFCEKIKMNKEPNWRMPAIINPNLNPNSSLIVAITNGAANAPTWIPT